MIMTKVPQHPRPHDFNYQFAIPIESATVRNTTICPIITQDEGLGAMSSYESNPANSNFVVAATDHCYPTSRINNIWSQLRVSMSKVMIETDKVHQIRFATMEIHTSFMDGELALDEVSTLDLNEILELQNEQTDRQTYPLFNMVDLADYPINSALDMPAETLGLDTDLEIEAVAFAIGPYYAALQYFTNGEKLKTIATKMRWHTLTKNKPYATINFHQHSNTKYMNPYTFLGAMVHVPPIGSLEQYGKLADTTVETSTLEFTFQARYNEFNHEFNHSLL